MPEPPIRTAIADDEALARSLLASLVRRDPELNLVAQSSSGGRALADVRTHRPELLLLDVQMPVLTGLQVVQRLIADGDAMPHVILVTAYDDYAIQAFELDVLDYLVKPVEKARFARAVERAKQAIRQRQICRLAERLMELGGQAAGTRPEPAASLLVRRGEELVSLRPEEIIWVEAANQYVQLHTDRGRFVVSENLSEYERRLDNPDFLRVHRSVLINGPRARRVRRRSNGVHEIELDNGERVSLARARRELLPLVLRWASR